MTRRRSFTQRIGVDALDIVVAFDPPEQICRRAARADYGLFRCRGGGVATAGDQPVDSGVYAGAASLMAGSGAPK